MCDRKKPTGKACILYSSTVEGKEAQCQIDVRKAKEAAAPKAKAKANVKAGPITDTAKLQGGHAKLRAENAKIRKTGAAGINPDEEEDETEAIGGGGQSKATLEAIIAAYDVEVRNAEAAE